MPERITPSPSHDFVTGPSLSHKGRGVFRRAVIPSPLEGEGGARSTPVLWEGEG